MIKPQQLWALFKTCPDDKWLGAVCRALGGQDVPNLDFGQKQMVQTIMLDNEWHTEAIAECKEKERLRKEKYRKEKAAEGQANGAADVPTDKPCPEMSHGQNGTDGTNGTNESPTDKDLSRVSRTIHSSVHSSVRSSVPSFVQDITIVRESKERNAHTLTKGFSELSESEAVEAGSKAGLPEDVARQVFAEMKANGGGYMSRGAFVAVTSENLQAAMRTMGKHAKPTTAKPKPKQHTAAEVENAKTLCAERCARFCNGKCGAGVAVLPSLSEHPHPPEDCSRFKELKAEKSGGKVAR